MTLAFTLTFWKDTLSKALHSIYTYYQMHAFPGNLTHDLSASNAQHLFELQEHIRWSCCAKMLFPFPPSQNRVSQNLNYTTLQFPEDNTSSENSVIERRKTRRNPIYSSLKCQVSDITEDSWAISCLFHLVLKW